MKDRDFLKWVHDRLVLTHGAPPNADYMHRLRCIIRDTPKTKDTARDLINYGEFEEELAKQGSQELGAPFDEEGTKGKPEAKS